MCLYCIIWNTDVGTSFLKVFTFDALQNIKQHKYLCRAATTVASVPAIVYFVMRSTVSSSYTVWPTCA